MCTDILKKHTSSGVRSSEKAVLLAASVGYVCEALGAEGASTVAAFVLVQALCLAWSKIVHVLTEKAAGCKYVRNI